MASAEPAAAPRTAAELANDAVSNLRRSVDGLGNAISAVRNAHAANDPKQWQEARSSLDRQLATATTAHQHTRAHSTDAQPRAAETLAAIEVALSERTREARDLQEAPIGFRRVANEDAILATLANDPTGDAHLGFARKETALKAQVDSLAHDERRELTRRLVEHRSNDSLATAFTTRLTRERQHRLLAHLASAPKREAMQREQRGIPEACALATSHPHLSVADEISVPEPESTDVRLRRVLEDGSDSLIAPQLGEIFATLDGTARRELARRLQGYRPGSGDDVSARFARLDRSLRLHLLASLQATAAPTSSTAAAPHQVTTDDVAHAAAPALAAPAHAGPASRDVPMTASVYARTHLDKIAAAIEHELSGRGLPQPHARLKWTSQKAAIDALIKELRAYMQADPGLGATRLYELAYPADLWTQIDERRSAAPADPKHPRGSADDVFHGPIGTRAWDPLVGIAVAGAIDAALLSSIQRMGMRLRVQLDNPVRVVYSTGDAAGLEGAAADELHTADLVASKPIDRLVANVLAEPEIVQGIKAKHGQDTPGRPFASGLKRVEFEWQGARDPKLWNWIRVSSPEHATAEEVAYTLYTDFGDANATPRSDQAYQLLVAAPYFGVPSDTARRHSAAWQHAPAEMRDPYSVRRPTGETTTDVLGLARSAVADDIALAQVPQTSQPAEAHGPTMERVSLQLEFLRDRLTPWHADGPLVGAQEFLSRRHSEAANDKTSAARWSAVGTAQESALHAIGSDLARIFSDLKSRGVTPADAAGLQPVVDVMKAYASAAGVSHFANQTTVALAAARQLASLLPLALAEDRIRQTRELVRDQQATQLHAGRVEEGSREPIASLPLLSDRAAQLRAKAARGETIAPGSVARLSVDADEMSLRSRLITLATQVRTVELRAREAGLHEERIAGDGFWTVQGVVSLLQSNIRSWTEALDKAKQWSGPIDGQTSEQTATGQLRQAVSTVEQRMVGFDDKLKIGEFLNWAHQRVADQRLRDAIAKIALEIGVMIVTGQVASAGIAALRGYTLAREAMLAGEIIGEARSAGLGFAALEIVTQAGMGTVTHGAMGGKMGPRELAENALGIGFANIAMRPFARLFKDASKAEAEIRTFAQLAKRSGKLVVRGSVELGVNVAVSAAAHYVTHFDHLEVASSDTWITQGFALLAGRFVHQRTAGMHKRIEHSAKASGTRAFDGLKNKVAALEARAAASTAKTSPEKASHLLEESHALLVEEKGIHERLANEGHADEVGAKAVERDLGAVGPEFVDVPLRLAGLKSVVDGEIYAGTEKQIRDALESAERLGIKVEQTFDPAKKVRTLRVGDREILLHEEFPTPKTTREWADELADSNPTKMSPEEIKADTAAYGERKATVERMYEEAMAGERPTPAGVSRERLQLAVKGDPKTGERIPLTYGPDPVEAKRLFDQFRRELQEVFKSEGITDAVVVQLGSGSTGWSSAPGKTGKPWAPTSDVDFAIFSDQALAQAKSVNAPVNPKNEQSGKYTTIWNNPKDGSPGFHKTPLGKKLELLSQRWNEIVFGDPKYDGFDLKLNLTDVPFKSAVPVIRPKAPTQVSEQ